MKKFYNAIAFILLCLSCLQHAYAKEKNSDFLSGDESTENAQIKKVHIELDKIMLFDDGMFVDLEGELFPVQFIGYDAQGYYVTPMYWKCMGGHIQSIFNWPVCIICHKGPKPSIVQRLKR